jgi:hypothetical protein
MCVGLSYVVINCCTFLIILFVYFLFCMLCFLFCAFFFFTVLCSDSPLAHSCLFFICVQFYRPLPPGGKPIAVNIITYGIKNPEMLPN